MLQKIRETPDGIKWEDLDNCYKNVQEDLDKLVASRDIFKINNPDAKMDIFYPNDKNYDGNSSYFSLVINASGLFPKVPIL